MKPVSESDPTLVSSSQQSLNLKQELWPLPHVPALSGLGAASVIQVRIKLEYSGFGWFSQTNMSAKKRAFSHCKRNWTVTHSGSSGWWLPPQPSVQPPEQQSWRGDSVRKQIKARQCDGGGVLGEEQKHHCQNPSQKQAAGIMQPDSCSNRT